MDRNRLYLNLLEIPTMQTTGHMHAVGMDEYKGVKIVNASTWQAQTAVQRMQNVVPQPACVPILNLGTGRGVIREF